MTDYYGQKNSLITTKISVIINKYESMETQLGLFLNKVIN
jgi:hypothetical protein